MKISKNITYKEATVSNTAKLYSIENVPNEFQLANMKMVAEKCFQPLRDWYGKPIGVSSFFRSEELNKKLGSSKTSQHLQGLYSENEEGAIDIDADVFDNGITNKAIFEWLKVNVEFDQLIWEYGSEVEPAWVHVSFRKGANRKMLLNARKNSKNKTYYTIR